MTNQEKRVRLRFAPSPTGGLHMGGVRTALFCYLYAKKHGGDFVLRIEDTDQTRFVEGAEKYIINSLKWCGIEPNEGVGFGDGPYAPYRQSERKELGIYAKYAQQLIDNGYAYYAFDTIDELKTIQYNAITRNNMRNSLTLSESEVSRLLEVNTPYVIRLKVPRNQDIRFHDIIRGWITVNTNQIDDKVLIKSDGMPTYHLAHIVDDIEMKISHVVRGEEWLPSAPFHVLLYRYLGLEDSMPVFAHLPLILDKNGKKLSKRDPSGMPMFPIDWYDKRTGEVYPGYKEMGFFPEVFINILALLGWNPGTTQEIFSMDELISSFSFERVSKAGARFDPNKAKWFNQQYLNKLSITELAESLMHILNYFWKTKINTKLTDIKYVEKICALLREKAVFISDLYNDGQQFFVRPTIYDYDKDIIKKKWNDKFPKFIDNLIIAFQLSSSFSLDEIDSTIKFVAEKEGIELKDIRPLLRIYICGVGVGPALVPTIEVLGKEEVIKRLETANTIIPTLIKDLELNG